MTISPPKRHSHPPPYPPYLRWRNFIQREAQQRVTSKRTIPMEGDGLNIQKDITQVKEDISKVLLTKTELMQTLID